jgi:hypothetical protein
MRRSLHRSIHRLLPADSLRLLVVIGVVQIILSGFSVGVLIALI